MIFQKSYRIFTSFLFCKLKFQNTLGTLNFKILLAVQSDIYMKKNIGRKEIFYLCTNIKG